MFASDSRWWSSFTLTPTGDVKSVGANRAGPILAPVGEGKVRICGSGGPGFESRPPDQDDPARRAFSEQGVRTVPVARGLIDPGVEGEEMFLRAAQVDWADPHGSRLRLCTRRSTWRDCPRGGGLGA